MPLTIFSSPCSTANGPLAAVRIKTPVTPRIIRNNVINKSVRARIAQLMRRARRKDEGVARADFGRSILIAHAALPGNHQVKFCLSRVRMVRAYTICPQEL